MIEGAVVNVLDYGAIANGVTDAAPAFNLAVAAIAATGGAIYVPSGDYAVKTEILVESANPITLFGDGLSSRLIIKANITGAIVRYKASGAVRNLQIIDTTTAGGAPGTYTCTAGLHLESFSASIVENVRFVGINCTATTGGAILTNKCIRSTIRNVEILYSKEGINLASVNLATENVTQALVIDGCFIEEIVGKSILVNDKTNQTKIISCGFESGAVVSGYQIDVKAGATGTSIEDCHFLRNPNFAIYSGSLTRIVGNYFETGLDNTYTIYVAGDSNVIASNTFRADSTSCSIWIESGNNNVIDGNVFRNSGAVQFGLNSAVTDTVVSNNSFLDLYASNNAQGYWVVDGPNASGSLIEGNTFRDTSAGPVKTNGFVLVYGDKTIVSNNAFLLRQAEYDVYCLSTNATIANNTGFDALADATGSRSSWSGNYFYDTGEPYYTMGGVGLNTGWTVSVTSTVSAFARRDGNKARVEIRVTATGGGTVAASSSATISSIPAAWATLSGAGTASFVTGQWYSPGTNESGLCYISGTTVYFTSAASATSGTIYVVLEYYTAVGTK